MVGFFILRERGLVDLDDEVKRYLPEFGDAVVGAKRTPLVRPMLVRHLLSHTSGIGFGPGFGYEPENDYEVCYVPLVKKVDCGEITSLAEWCRELAKVPLRRGQTHLNGPFSGFSPAKTGATATARTCLAG